MKTAPNDVSHGWSKPRINRAGVSRLIGSKLAVCHVQSPITHNCPAAPSSRRLVGQKLAVIDVENAAVTLGTPVQNSTTITIPIESACDGQIVERKRAAGVNLKKWSGIVATVVIAGKIPAKVIIAGPI